MLPSLMIDPSLLILNFFYLSFAAFAISVQFKFMPHDFKIFRQIRICDIMNGAEIDRVRFFTFQTNEMMMMFIRAMQLELHPVIKHQLFQNADIA